MNISLKNTIKFISFGIYCLLFLLLFSARSIANQTSIDCGQQLGDFVRVSDFNSAYICASKILETDPSNVEAQLVFARAAQELGQNDIAAEYAQSARKLPLNRIETYASFLISGLAETNRGNTVIAQYYLRRAANVARNQSELALIGRAMNFARAQSPWSFSISANIDPSNNVNDGSLHETYDTVFGPGWAISEDGQAQPGIGYSLDLSATHRYLFSNKTLIETQAYSLNTIYSGLGRNDYTLGLKTSVTHIQTADIPIRWIASIAYEQRSIGDELGGPVFVGISPYLNQTIVTLERRWEPSAGRIWSTYGNYTLRNYDGSSDVYSEIFRVGAFYSFPLRPNIDVGLSAYVEQTDSNVPTFLNKAGGLAMNVNWDLLEHPYRLSGRLAFVHTEYEYPADLAPEPRLENKVSLDLGVTPRRIQWFGFRPTFGLELTRNFSDNNRYDTFEASAYTKIQSVF